MKKLYNLLFYSIYIISLYRLIANSTNESAIGTKRISKH